MFKLIQILLYFFITQIIVGCGAKKSDENPGDSDQHLSSKLPLSTLELMNNLTFLDSEEEWGNTDSDAIAERNKSLTYL